MRVAIRDDQPARTYPGAPLHPVAPDCGRFVDVTAYARMCDPPQTVNACPVT